MSGIALRVAAAAVVAPAASWRSAVRMADAACQRTLAASVASRIESGSEVALIRRARAMSGQTAPDANRRVVSLAMWRR